MARILSVSKGLYLKSSVSQRVEQNILWWCESSRKTSKGVNSLKENLPRKIRLMGNIHVYVWLATCDLTSKTKGGAVSLIDAGHIRAIPNTGTEINYFPQ